ncbi:MAG: hypothetical protein M1838_000004 [Thelocarpon superellum]|nr:MAG: hypothetical protein M1838_000004 [Thelocarpon superellum]
MSNRRPAPRPKRAGESFARTQHLTDDSPSSKKPRFDVRNPSALAPDAPEEDAVLELDEIGKGGQKTKRSAVNLDGYGSDSSNEGFDSRADAKAREAKQKEETEARESNDMFAELEDDFKDGDDDEAIRAGSKGKKDVRFLEADEIEGQEAYSRAGGRVDVDFTRNGAIPDKGKRKDGDSSDESEDEENADKKDVDEEVGAGGLKSHAPKLDAFNMRGELEEGRFDTQGNFVRKAADPDAVHDSWLEGVSKKDMKRARDAAEKREEERRRTAREADQVLTADILRTLITRLEKSETVLEALARWGRGGEKKKKQPKWQNKNRARKRQDEMDLDADADTTRPPSHPDPAETRRTEAVEAITGAADHLLTRGQTNIYDDTRETLIRQFRRETDEDWVEAAAPKTTAPGDDVDGVREQKQWEYRWTDGRDGGDTYGPYDGPTMIAWMDAGFFGDGVEFRRNAKDEGGVGGEWSRSVDFVEVLERD